MSNYEYLYLEPMEYFIRHYWYIIAPILLLSYVSSFFLNPKLCLLFFCLTLFTAYRFCKHRMKVLTGRFADRHNDMIAQRSSLIDAGNSEALEALTDEYADLASAAMLYLLLQKNKESIQKEDYYAGR